MLDNLYKLYLNARRMMLKFTYENKTYPFIRDPFIDFIF